MNMYIVIAVIFATITAVAHLCNKHMYEDITMQHEEMLHAMHTVERRAEAEEYVRTLNMG